MTRPITYLDKLGPTVWVYAHVFQDTVYSSYSQFTSMIVEYDIILSQTYRVPVLYIRLPYQVGKGVQGIEFIHRHLITKSLAPNLDRVGVLGGVTMTVGSQ